MSIVVFFIVAALADLEHVAYAQANKQTERLASQTPPAVRACIGCHGKSGEGNPPAGSPRIAGQAAYYLLKQLDSYADGSRRSRIMEPIARGLPPELRADVAAHYASIDAAYDERHSRRRPPERGRVLAMQGDNRLGVQACRNCHGPGGVGEPPHIPYIAGLDANYLIAELTAWKRGTRTNDAGQQMFTVVTVLSAEDISAVAQYYASLPPPKPAPNNLPQGARQKTGSGNAPLTSQPTLRREKSIGIDQGAPMRGNTQGRDDGYKIGPDVTGNKATSSTEASELSRRQTLWPRLTETAKAETRRVSNQSVRAGDPERGRSIIASSTHGCPACHTIPGIRVPRGIVGPPLGGIGRRGFIAGQLPNRSDVLVAFLLNPPQLVPETGMPNVGLTLEEAQHIASYLYTLEASRERQ